MSITGNKKNFCQYKKVQKRLEDFRTGFKFTFFVYHQYYVFYNVKGPFKKEKPWSTLEKNNEGSPFLRLQKCPS